VDDVIEQYLMLKEKSKRYSTALRKMTSMVAFGVRKDGLYANVPKETIFKGMATKIDLHKGGFIFLT
jgi:hypothetical protein